MAVGHINGMAALTGFSHKNMYRCFARTEKSGCNNEMSVR